MRSWYSAMVVLVACHGPSVDRGDRSPAPVMASVVPSAAPEAGVGSAEAGVGSAEAGVGSAEAGAPPISPPVEPRDPALLKVPVGAAAAPVRSICFIQGDCRGTGKLDQSAFVQVEQGGGVSCEESRVPSACPNMAGGVPINEDAGFSPLCAAAAPLPHEPRPAEGGRPREQAKAELRRLVAKGAPCRGEPPGSRLRYHHWCDTYRSDGTLVDRGYFGQVAGGGERMWFQELDEHGKVTQEHTECDAGHR